MNQHGKNEELFFIVFEDLIKTFAEDRKVVSKEKKGFSKDFITDFDSGKPTEKLDMKKSEDSIGELHRDSAKLNKKFDEFIEVLEKTTFSHYIIPYDEITKCVFDNTPEEDLDEFTESLKYRGNFYFSKTKSKNDSINESSEQDKLDPEKMYYKILRHINLALVQKYTLTRMQISEIETLKQKQTTLIDSYNKLKQEAEEQYKKMLTQFITILGIFAAILMGAFGAIQGFGNLFDNAHKLPIGIILIISSIGASSVLLILFFLLNGIAKLTDKSLSSTSKENGTLIEKHPTLIITHGILITISLMGASLELSNINIEFTVQELWWLFPILWTIYFIIAFNKKSFNLFRKI